MTAPSPTPLATLRALYDRTHGVALSDIRPEPVGGTGASRRAFWRDVWRALEFETSEPTGSSRLFEVAWALAAAGGSASDMLVALHEVVSDELPLSSAYESLCKALWIPASSDPERYAEAFDFVTPIPREQTRRQAYLVLWFARDLDRYSADELGRLRSQLGGPTGLQRELWLDDVLGPMPPREAIAAIMVRVVELVAASSSFLWCTWDDRAEALSDLRRVTADFAAGAGPSRLQVFFLATGDLQEVSMENGWSDEYIDLAERFDEALTQLD